MLPQLILTDIDGVWTDGGMYYDQKGNEWKKFNTSDGLGILLCKKANILTGIITGEQTKIVERRAKKLKVDFLFQGIKNKLKKINDVCEKLKIDLEKVAYIGDDINDFHLLKKVGYSGAPNNAPTIIKNIVNYTTEKDGGNGAFREFVEHIFSQNEILDKTLEKLIEEYK